MPSEEPDLTQEPFAQLIRDHREIEARVAGLERAVEQLTDSARRASALATIADTIEYFGGPAASHQEDEENTLFPQLRPLEGFAQMLSAIEFQHQMNDTTYAELRAAFEAFAPGTPTQLSELARQFADMQRAHVMAEERALFPRAAAELSPEIIEQMRDEMAERRSR